MITVDIHSMWSPLTLSKVGLIKLTLVLPYIVYQIVQKAKGPCATCFAALVVKYNFRFSIANNKTTTSSQSVWLRFTCKDGMSLGIEYIGIVPIRITLYDGII